MPVSPGAARPTGGAAPARPPMGSVPVPAARDGADTPAGPLSDDAGGPTRTERPAGLTVRGRSLLAGGLAMVVCAVVLDERDLVRVGAFVVLLPLLALLVALRSRRTLLVGRSLEPVRGQAGEPGTVVLRIAGGSLLGSLRIADTVPDAAGPSDRSPPRFTVHRLGRRGARVGYPLHPAVRGAYRIGPLRARGTDALGLAEFRHDVLAADRWLVLPRVTPLTGRPTLSSTAAGRGAEGGSRPGPGTPDVLIRPYRQGDELRRVHWRSSARRDELMVRLDDRPDPAGVTLLLDRRAAAHRGHGADSSLEWAVEFAASVTVHLLRRGEAVVLVDESGRRFDDGGVMDPVSGEDAVPQRLETLAVLRPSATAALGAADPGPGTPAGVLAVLGATAPRDVTALVTAWPSGGHAILLDVDDWSAGTSPGRTAAHAAAALRRAGWQSTVVSGGTSVHRAWADACGAPAAPGGAR
ncbi:DUF58 domain-containing protein [Pseudonocardia sp. NPDC049635]|uniref:DUF58 domain-containing protein n=1 Tax=Pseudonocardia sp. NPDC049635 TaxID=3155506 RepID=UPI0033E0EA02